MVSSPPPSLYGDDLSEPLARMETAHMATTTVKVEGMTCGACTSAVEAGFKGIDGAGAVTVSLVMGRAVIHHDPTKLSAQRVAEIIEDRGFDAEVLSTNLPTPAVSANTFEECEEEQHVSDGLKISTTTLSVGGMTCGACTSSVEAGFKDVPGIKSMSVSLLSERAIVEHESAIISPEHVAEIIEDRGFDATILESRVEESSKAAAKRRRLSTSRSKIATTTVAIQGMTCGACTSAIEGAFKEVAGLVHFNISLLAERAVIVHEPTVLSTETIIELIDDAGFDASIVSSVMGGSQKMESSLSEIQLKIFGIPDGSAATAMEDSLRLKTGVTAAVISLSSSRAAITYNSSLIGLRALVESIKDAGYIALVADSEDNNAQLESLAKTKEIQEWRRAFWISLSLAIPVFCISMLIPMFVPAIDFGAWRLIPGLYLGDVICLVLTVPVQFGIGKRFYKSAFKSLKHRSPTMDVLVVLGTSAAFFFSSFAIIIAILFPPHTRPSTVFDTSTMLITFITLGRWLENRAKGQTSKALSRLMSLAPSMATIYDDPIAAEKAAEGWDLPFSPVVEKKVDALFDEAIKASRQAAGQKIIPTELIQVGDIVILRPGDKVPADGTVTRGESYIDESMVTGEAMPILKKTGNLLMAGTVNGAGRIDFRVTRAGKDTQLSQIVTLVQQAQTSRAPIQRMADLVAGYFVPIIIALGLITFISWMVLSHVLPHPPKVFVDEQSGGKFMVCLKLCISVIVFACPCALGLATPTAVMVGTGIGAEHGILVKGGAALETATKITHVVLDKTGTLTFGKMDVAEINLEPAWSANDWRRRLWWTVVGLAETGSEHPVAKAIVGAARENLGLGDADTFDGVVRRFEVKVGGGITASITSGSSQQETYDVLIGNATFLRSKGVTVPGSPNSSRQPSLQPSPQPSPSISQTSLISEMPLSGRSSINIAISGQYAGHLALSDTLKPTAPAAIKALRKMGISTSLVTGDTYETAVIVAKLVGIPPESVRASVSPGQKQEIISELQSQGERVAMVGDGINDSPALASADIGIGLSSGTDIAIEAADIILMKPDDLLNIPASLCLSRTIFNRIKLNLLWACLYNFIGLPFAMGVFLPLGVGLMPPMMAGAAMALSSVSVVTSSLLLRYWKRPKWLDVDLLEKDLGYYHTFMPLRRDKMKNRRQHFGAIGWMRSFVSGVVPWGTKDNERDRGKYVQLGTIEPPV